MLSTGRYPNELTMVSAIPGEDHLRTVPTLQRDDAKPDDVDTDQEDHCGDAARYACNSTPRVATECRFIIG